VNLEWLRNAAPSLVPLGKFQGGEEELSPSNLLLFFALDRPPPEGSMGTRGGLLTVAREMRGSGGKFLARV
jgi:hypothetical protein